ncbi:MAG: NosD domain-containing protein [Candidatus Thorarchaeota archaeon]
MCKNRGLFLISFLLVGMMLPVMTGTLLPTTQQVVEPVFVPSELTPHSPIEITSDAEFASQAASESWAGNGSETAPYVIENLNITTEDVAIHISNTSSYFIIQDCYLTTQSDEETSNESLWSCILFLEVSNGLIDNCTVRSQRAAIGIVGSTNCEVKDSDLEGGGTFVTVWTNYATQCIVTNNTIHGMLSSFESSDIHISFNRLTGYSIWGVNLQDSTISNNTVYSMRFEGHDTIIANNSLRDSIQIYDSHNLDILSNTLADGMIWIYGEFEVFWTSHTILNNTGDGKPIIYVKDVMDLSFNVSTNHQVIVAGVTNCTFYDGSFTSQPIAFLVRYSHSCKFEDNFGYNVSTFIDVRDSENCTFTGNLVEVAEMPFRIYNCDGANFSYNTVTFAQFSVEIAYSDNCVINSNTIFDCWEGVHHSQGSGTVINSNIIGNCFEGISLTNCQNVNARWNDVSNCTNGISIVATDDSRFIQNTLFDSTEYGFELLSGVNNTIYDNTFFSNQLSNAIDDGTDNNWDDGISLGNYWDDYDGTGTYSIQGSAGSLDHYPRGPQVTSTTTTNSTTATETASSTTTSTPATSTPPPTGDDNTVLILVVFTIGIVAVAIVIVFYIRYRVVLQRTIEGSTQ